ncbi:MAG: ParB N-terminal domain-containing protein, partial [Thaumarchaeota archaeon]|nr:ParB N-terminal domain-containing protein [Nitrososphaerota archaeon]
QMRDQVYEEEEDLKQLALGIQRIGMTQLPMVRPSPTRDGYFELMTGHRRKEAVTKYLGWKQMRCEVYKNLPEETVLYIVGEDNLARRNIYPYEKGKYFDLWHEKLDDTEIGNIFGTTAQAIYLWRTFAEAIDELSGSLTRNEVAGLKKFATRAKIDLLLKIESEEDLEEGCRLLARGEDKEKIEQFVVRSLYESSRHSRSSAQNAVNGSSSAGEEEDGDNVKKLITILKNPEKSKTYEEAVDRMKEAKDLVMKTLDDYMQVKAQLKEIQNAKIRSTITIKKAGPVKVIHKMDDDGDILCIHEQKGGKPIPIKFRLN